LIDPGALPGGWSLVPLGELLTAIDSGKSFKCEERPPEAHEVGVIKVSAVSWGEYQESESKTCLDAERIEPNYFVRPGDFLFSRANTIDLVGACVIVSRVSKRLMLSDKILRLHFAAEELKPWVLQYLRSKAGRTQIETLTSGNQESMRNIGQERLRQILIPLPPRYERESISVKLDELMSDLATASGELQAAERKLTLYRQSLLKSAVEGTLSAEWRAQNPHKETGTDLLARILIERRARWEARQLQKFKARGMEPPKHWQKEYRHPVAPDLQGLPAIPKGWTWASAGQLLDSLTSGSRDWAPYYGRGDCTFVMAQNVRPWRPDFSFRQAVDPPEFDRDRARSEVRIDDLLVTIVGANTGQSCRVAKSLPLHFVCQSVALLRPVFTETSEFLNAVLNSPTHGQRYFEAMNYGAGRPHLSFEQLELLPVPLPPLLEQSAIARALILHLEALDDQMSTIERGLRLANAQRQNILRAAFAGRLVPQDPNDEPASVLLERIRAQRPASAAKARRKPGRPAKVAA
jgi:type I restriction enzyme, S subunit